ncbi:MAG: cytochrome P450 [Pseudonocardiales bacterium]|nr:cytochrome P450 [Pseudonocardiales bacterium]
MSRATELPEAVDKDSGDKDSGYDEVLLALTRPECHQDPHPFYAQMRRQHPVYCSTHGIWYLTRYADVEAAVQDARLSNDRERMTRALAARQGAPQRLSRLTRRLGRVVSNTDPPDHTRLRKLINKAFTARRIHALRPGIQTIVDELLAAALAAGPTIDLIAALASPLPTTVICELFGIPPRDTDRVRAWFHQVRGPTTAEDLHRVEQAVEQFEGYLADLIRQRRADPAEDILSALVAAQERGDQLTDDELLSTCFVLVTAGDQTTTNLIGNSMLALLRHPDQLRRLRQDPTLIRSAIHELARYDSPSHIIIRVVAEPTEIGGYRLAEGELVYLVLAAANRDPDRFPDPDQLDLSRSDNRHLSFGTGPRFCLGAPLARMQGEIAIGTLVQRLPALRLDTEAVQWQPNPMLRGPACLPLAY